MTNAKDLNRHSGARESANPEVRDSGSGAGAPSRNDGGSIDQDQFLTILSREEALARFEAALFPRAAPGEQRPLADALGSALSEDVFAPIDVPPFDRSNVDGFAVRGFEDFDRLISTAPGRTVTINLERNGAPSTVTLVPSSISGKDRFGNDYRVGDIGLAPPPPIVADVTWGGVAMWSGLLLPGDVLRGHEFHYARVTDPGTDLPFAEIADGQGRPLGPSGGRRGLVSGTFFHAIAKG